jgi:hypothetical protein
VAAKLAATGRRLDLIDHSPETRGNGPWVQGGLSEILEVDRVCSEGQVTTRRPRTNIGELVNPAVLAHPQRERIVELMNAGRFELRRMLPSPDTDPDRFTWDDAIVQAVVVEDDGRRHLHLRLPAVNVWPLPQAYGGNALAIR